MKTPTWFINTILFWISHIQFLKSSPTFHFILPHEAFNHVSLSTTPTKTKWCLSPPFIITLSEVVWNLEETNGLNVWANTSQWPLHDPQHHEVTQQLNATWKTHCCSSHSRAGIHNNQWCAVSAPLWRRCWCPQLSARTSNPPWWPRPPPGTWAVWAGGWCPTAFWGSRRETCASRWGERRKDGRRQSDFREHCKPWSRQDEFFVWTKRLGAVCSRVPCVKGPCSASPQPHKSSSFTGPASAQQHSERH